MPKQWHVFPPFYYVARFLLRGAGWKLVGEQALDGINKAVAIGAFHTSNWDGVVAFPVAFALNVRFRIMAKESLFRFPFGWLMRGLGAIPIDRQSRHNVVEQSIAQFEKLDSLILVLAPEGTRRYAHYWKTGFYHIALGAGVPLILAYVDYLKKEVGIGKVLHLSGDMQTDMDAIRAFYEGGGFAPRNPEWRGPVILREEG